MIVIWKKIQDSNVSELLSSLLIKLFDITAVKILLYA